MFCLQIISFLVLITEIFGGVLILSPKHIEISGLKLFDQQSYNILRESFDKDKIISFQIDSEQIPIKCKDLLEKKYSNYVPSVNYIPANTIYKNSFLNCDEIKKQVQFQQNLYLIFHNSPKIKRSAVDSPLTDLNKDELSVIDEDLTNKPVLYDAQGKALLYSNQPLVFRKPNDTIIVLGNTTIVTFDDRDNYSRLSCTIPLDDGKITLRFRFPWENHYWYLTLVEIEDSSGKINLTNTIEVSAPKGFSYACGGETIFTDSSGTTTLTLYNLQIQPKTKDGQFSDAYNCVPFVTGPICSGLFVSSILAIGLLIGLNALGSIKTMDKFDNSKTKQLTITIMGE